MSATDHPGERLSAYLDDELSPAERASVEQHLRECPSCPQLLEELAAVDSAARTLAVAAPEGYFDAFPGRLRERLAARRPRRIPAWTWAAAAAVLLAVLTPLTMRARRPAPATNAEMQSPVRTTDGDRPAQEEPSFRRTQPAAATAAPPTTLVLTAEAKEKLRALGYVGDEKLQAEGKTREFRQKRDAAQDDRLRERDADTRASGAGVVGGVVGGRAGAAPRAADLKDAELKKEAFGEKEAADKANENVAAASAGVPAPVPESVVAAPAPQLAARADESAAHLQRAEPQKQSPALARPPNETSGADQPAAPPPAKAAPADGYAAKPRPNEGALGATKAVSTPNGAVSADEAGFAAEFAAIASRPLLQAEAARTAARQWRELARRYPQVKAADEARVRAIEALATAWRLEHKDADRDQARKEARAYLAAGGPLKDRVRALLDQLER